MLGQREHDRRSQEEARDPVLLHRLQEGLQLEARHAHDGGAAVEALVHDHVHPVDVEEGQDRQDLLVLVDVLDDLGLDQVGDQVAVRQHHALGEAGGAAGVGQRDQVLGRVDIDRGRLAQAEQGGEGGDALGLAEHRDLLDARLACRLARLLQQRRHRQQQLGLRVLELERDLVGGVERVQSGVDATGQGNPVEGHGVLGQVGRHDRQHIALAEATFMQARGELAHRFVELGVRVAATAGRVHDRLLGAHLLRVPEHERREWGGGDAHVRVGALEDHGHRIGRRSAVHGPPAPAAAESRLPRRRLQ